MKTRNFTLFFVAAGVFAVSIAEIADACPFLECANFTDSQKISDCNYIVSEVGGDEQQEVLCILWEQSYDYQNQNLPYYPLEINLEMDASEIDTSQFVTAGKIFLFGFFNYFAFSLTKSSVVMKWLHVA